MLRWMAIVLCGICTILAADQSKMYFEVGMEVPGVVALGVSLVLGAVTFLLIFKTGSK